MYNMDEVVAKLLVTEEVVSNVMENNHKWLIDNISSSLPWIDIPFILFYGVDFFLAIQPWITSFRDVAKVSPTR